MYSGRSYAFLYSCWTINHLYHKVRGIHVVWNTFQADITFKRSHFLVHFKHVNHRWLYFAVRSADVFALRNLPFLASAFVIDFLHWNLLSPCSVFPLSSQVLPTFCKWEVIGKKSGRSRGFTNRWNPWFYCIFSILLISPKISFPDFPISRNNIT